MAFKKTQTTYDVPVRNLVKTISNSDLDSNKELIIRHHYATKVVEAKIYTPSGEELLISNVFNIANSTYNEIKFSFGGDLATGNHLMILKFYIL